MTNDTSFKSEKIECDVCSLFMCDGMCADARFDFDVNFLPLEM